MTERIDNIHQIYAPLMTKVVGLSIALSVVDDDDDLKVLGA
jgi:hypothetical protein